MELKTSIPFPNGMTADSVLSPVREGNGLVKITIPTRASLVQAWKDDPVSWHDISVKEIYLPEDFFSEEILARLRS
jgi:hypothetical protein